MGTELFDLLGVNPDDPRVRDAIMDARDAERLIDTLVQLRKRLGITQSELAQDMETTQSAVSKFERAGGDPHLSTLQRYARSVGARLRFAFDVSPRQTPTWQASYRIPAGMEQDLDEPESESVLSPRIGLAS
ncbi:helix-turn-helix domain-containing protein [Micromonospora sp. NBC_01699]|uniref:helix-turn-helix domain-containing protein n=1 Tax=Micromonospora sp. NBC_01699 TaxID=2975984 RepID=UPI003FA5CDC7